MPWNGSTIYNSLITVIYNIKQNRFILFKETNVEFKLLVLFSICMVPVLFLKKKKIDLILFTESAFNDECMI